MGNGITFYLDNLAEDTEAEIERCLRQVKEEIQLERLVKSGE